MKIAMIQSMIVMIIQMIMIRVLMKGIFRITVDADHVMKGTHQSI